MTWCDENRNVGETKLWMMSGSLRSCESALCSDGPDLGAREERRGEIRWSALAHG